MWQSPGDKLLHLYQSLEGGASERISALLNKLAITWHTSPDELRRIPSRGPAVVVSNHPFGLLDGAVLTLLLRQVRPDVKVLTNRLLAGVPGLDEVCLFVDPFGGRGAAESNLEPLRRALRWLRQGGMLLVFPAGEVSRWDARDGARDSGWHPAAGRLARAAAAPVLPVHLPGSNSLPFHVVGALSARLRVLALPGELLKSRGRCVEVHIGHPVTPREMESLGDPAALARYLRSRVYLMARRGPAPAPAPAPPDATSPVARLGGCEVEIARLSPRQLLEDSKEFAVYVARSHQIPSILCEIGRLREETFRAAGEGTGRPLDLDRFDRYYYHLFLWNKQKCEVAGAYRLGRTSEILAARGIPGLYTSTLFEFDPRFFSRIGPAIELGRSFVRPEYQKQYHPLLLLWRGIVRFVQLDPRAAVLFGAVSVSGSYSEASRRLIVCYCEKSAKDGEMARYLKPRRPFRTWLRDWEADTIGAMVRNLDDLDGPLADLEPDGKGVPVLLRQYVKLGGRLLAFNVDPSFSDSLDGLVVVDLRRTSRTFLERYMGRDGAAAFLAAHRVIPAA